MTVPYGLAPGNGIFKLIISSFNQSDTAATPGQAIVSGGKLHRISYLFAIQSRYLAYRLPKNNVKILLRKQYAG
jgi:hypothetical protein